MKVKKLRDTGEFVDQLLSKSFFCCCLLSICWVSLASPREQHIEVNGLTAGKAVVVIQGRSYVLGSGDTVKGVTLVSADQHSAVLRILGKDKRFYLQEAKLEDYSDDFIVESTKVTAEQADILASDVLVSAKSHILSARPIAESIDSVKFGIDYFYDASYGEYAVLQANTLYNGVVTQCSSYTYTKLMPGRNLIDIRIMVRDEAPEACLSDAVLFEMIGSKKINGSSAIGAKYMPFKKEWKKRVQAHSNLGES